MAHCEAQKKKSLSHSGPIPHPVEHRIHETGPRSSCFTPMEFCPLSAEIQEVQLLRRLYI